MKSMKRFVFVGLALGVATGCDTPDTPEEKALAKERVELIKMEATIVQQNPSSCIELGNALGELVTKNSARLTTFNAHWKALPEAKRKSLMNPLREESNPYFATLTSSLTKCGTEFPVM
jgi:hypothetical protein